MYYRVTIIIFETRSITRVESNIRYDYAYNGARATIR